MKPLWEKEVTMPAFDALEGNTQTDVLIIGGGLTGLLCAQKLQAAGVDYLLVEAERLCHGTTGNTTAKITAQHGLIYDKLIRRFGLERAKQYLDANLLALEEYEHLCGQISCDFEKADSYVYSLDRAWKLERELRALERLGYPAELASSVALPICTVGAVRFPNQAYFQPMKFCAGVAEGLNIREHTRVMTFDEGGISTNRGRIRAKKIIVATHFPLFNKHGSYFLKMYQHRSYVLALEGVVKPAAMYVDENDKGLSFRPCGDMLLLGGGSHKTGKRGGGWRELENFSSEYFPGAQIRARWATQDCMTLDDVPYIGQYSAGTPDVYVATGFNKWGMTSAMVAADLLRDLVLGKENPYEAVFSPSRSILRPQLVVNGLEAIGNILRPTRPRCPHMGCALKWNAQEKSWDCSCHGSRFSEKGEVLDGPANGNLKL